MKITCLKELKKREELQQNDIVEFVVFCPVGKKVLTYEVSSYFLGNYNQAEEATGFVLNNAIFDILGMPVTEKNKFAEKAYGYKPLNSDSDSTGCGNWPESAVNDYPALTRLAEALYRIAEGRPEEPEVEDDMLERYEILDLRKNE